MIPIYKISLLLALTISIPSFGLNSVQPTDFSEDVYIVTEELRLGVDELDEPWSAILVGEPRDSLPTDRVIRLFEEPSMDSNIFSEFYGNFHVDVLGGLSKWYIRVNESDPARAKKRWVYDCWLLVDLQGTKKWCNEFNFYGSTDKPNGDYIYSSTLAPGYFEVDATGYVLKDQPSEESEIAGYFPYTDTGGIEKYEIDNTLHLDYLYTIKARTEEWLFITAYNPQIGWIKSDIPDKRVYQLAFFWPLPVPGPYEAGFYLPTTDYVDQVLITVYTVKRYSEDNIFVNPSLIIINRNGSSTEATPEFFREDGMGSTSTYFYRAVFEEKIPKNEIADIVFVCGEDRVFEEKYLSGRIQIGIDFPSIWGLEEQ